MRRTEHATERPSNRKAILLTRIGAIPPDSRRYWCNEARSRTCSVARLADAPQAPVVFDREDSRSPATQARFGAEIAIHGAQPAREMLTTEPFVQP
jgi:hypothetical protein